MSDLPLPLPAVPARLLAAALDRERKIDRALEALGPLAGRDVIVVGGGRDELARYAAAGARPIELDADTPPWPAADGSADVIVSAWAGFRGVDPAALREVDRVLRPAGRLLVIHDYGRDDVSRLRGELPEYGSWTRRDGPFLTAGFRIRVLHCFWTFDTIDDAAALLGAAFGEAGTVVATGLKRPRLSWNVALYHRSRGAGASADDAADRDGDASERAR